MSKFFHIISRIIRWCLYGLALSIPIGNAPVEIFSNVAAGLFLLESLVRGVAWLRGSERGRKRIAWDPFFAAMACYVVWNVVSVFFSIHSVQSAAAVYTKLLEVVLIFFCAVRHLRRKTHLFIVLGCLGAGAILASLNGLIQWITGTDFIRHSSVMFRHDGRRISGAFKHPNGLGGYLAALIPLGVSWIVPMFSGRPAHWRQEPAEIQRPVMTGRRGRRIGALAAVGLCSAALGLTFSRGAWLGCFAGLLLLAFRNKRLLGLMIVSVMVFSAVFGPWMLKSRSRAFGLADEGSLRPLAGRSLTQIVKETSSGRCRFWQDAFEMARENPWTGSGLNTYTEFLNAHPDTFKGYYAHNCYLQMAVEIGFVGVAFYILMLIFFFIRIGRDLLQVRDPLLCAVGGGAASGVLAFSIHAFFDTTMYSVQLAGLPWLLMGLSFCTVRLNNAENK